MPQSDDRMTMLFLARFGEVGLVTRLAEQAALMMATRERMVALCEGERDMVQCLARLTVLLEILEQSGMIAIPSATDPDAWARPGLALARLTVAAARWLQGKRDFMAQCVADVRPALDRIAAPLRDEVDAALAQVREELG